MPYQLSDGRTVSAESSFELNDILYSPNWLKFATEQERLDLGITWVNDPEPAPSVTFIPQIVTPYQARVALSAAGLRDQVEAAVASSDQATRDAWEYGVSVDRNSPMIINLGTALGLTSDQIDQLFIQAAQVQ